MPIQHLNDAKKKRMKFGTKTELKNLNSFSNVRKGLEYEVQRQAEILRSGGQIR